MLRFAPPFPFFAFESASKIFTAIKAVPLCVVFVVEGAFGLSLCGFRQLVSENQFVAPDDEIGQIL